jgi:hypothetical protein
MASALACVLLGLLPLLPLMQLGWQLLPSLGIR